MKRIVVLMTTVALGAGCAGEDAPPTFRVGTYNAGLALGYVELAEERAPVTLDALSQQDLDLLCVQEVWENTHVQLLRSEMVQRMPNSVYRVAEPGSVDTPDAACTLEELDPLKTCVEANCAGVPDDMLADCALTFCGMEFGNTQPACQSCLAANVGKSIDEILMACGPGGDGDAYAYGGAFGTMILTDAPILEHESLLLDSKLVRRAVLYAKVQTEGADMHVFCTHLSPIFESIPYPGEGTWVEEQANQIDALMAFVNQKAGNDPNVVILGDFNTGPGKGNAVAEASENYQKLLAAGFRNAYADAPDATCSFCSDNLLVLGEKSVLIDHVLTRTSLDVSEPGRFLTERTEVKVDGINTPTNYSDHYGVSALITF